MSPLAAALGEHFFWITSRASGVAALLASSAAVTLGLLMGGRLTKRRLPDHYARARIGPARWRRLHRFTALAWVLGVVHGIAEGTDAGAAWFLVTAAAVVLPAAALLVVRIAQPRVAPSPA